MWTGREEGQWWEKRGISVILSPIMIKFLNVSNNRKCRMLVFKFNI